MITFKRLQKTIKEKKFASIKVKDKIYKAFDFDETDEEMVYVRALDKNDIEFSFSFYDIKSIENE